MFGCKAAVGWIEILNIYGALSEFAVVIISGHGNIDTAVRYSVGAYIY